VAEMRLVALNPVFQAEAGVVGAVKPVSAGNMIAAAGAFWKLVVKMGVAHATRASAAGLKVAFMGPLLQLMLGMVVACLDGQPPLLKGTIAAVVADANTVLSEPPPMSVSFWHAQR